MSERAISERHRAILRVINDKLTSSGFPPSVREIASAVGLASPSTVKHHLDSFPVRRTPIRPAQDTPLATVRDIASAPSVGPS